MNSSGIKRSTTLIVAVLGGQTLALSIMLGAAWMLSAFSDSASSANQAVGDCVVATVSESPATAMNSSQLLNLSVGWLR